MKISFTERYFSPYHYCYVAPYMCPSLENAIEDQIATCQLEQPLRIVVLKHVLNFKQYQAMEFVLVTIR